MRILISDTLENILSELPSLISHIYDPSSLHINITNKQPDCSTWNQNQSDTLSWIPDPIASYFPQYKYNSSVAANDALQSALIAWAQDNKPKLQPVSLQDISAGDVIRGTWAEKETNVSHSIEGEVDSVHLEYSELWLVNNSRLEIKETQDFTTTTLHLIKKAPEGKLLQPQDLRTLPIGSLLTVTFSHPSMCRGKPYTREKVALTRRHEEASGFSYDLDVNTYPESSILKVILLSQPNSKGNN